MPEVRKVFGEKLSGTIPDAPGYETPEGRRETDEMLRSHVAGELETLRDKLDELRQAADEEGEEDMVDDVDRIDARLLRTVEALRGAETGGLAFFQSADPSGADVERVCAYDLALLEDVNLLVHDVNGLKYETIGNLTLREIEGTLAAIELKVTNRRDNLDSSGRD